MLFECFTFTFLFNLIKQGKLSQRKPCYFSNKKKYGSCNLDSSSMSVVCLLHNHKCVLVILF